MTPEEQMKAKALMDITEQAPLISALLLNATFSYLTWRKPMDYDEKTFEEAFQTVKNHWNSLQQQIIAASVQVLGPKKQP